MWDTVLKKIVQLCNVFVSRYSTAWQTTDDDLFVTRQPRYSSRRLALQAAHGCRHKHQGEDARYGSQ